VSGGYGPGARVVQSLQEGHGQGGALVGVCACPHLVDENQAVAVNLSEDSDYVGHM